MACKICGWLCALFCADADVVAARANLWKQSEKWESAHSNEYKLWSRASDQERERLDAAATLQTTDPEAAFRMYLDLADAGVVWAMQIVAHQYAWGTIVPNDFEQAQIYYCRAIEAGSWMATLRYAWLMARQGYFEESETVLQDGVNADFVPASYWLARCRYHQSSDRKTCRVIRPLLEHAVEAGHPGAALFLARLKARGKFGFREIPRGFKEMIQVVERTHDAVSSSGSNPISAATAQSSATRSMSSRGSIDKCTY